MISIYILDTSKLEKSDFYTLCDSLPFGQEEKIRLVSMKSSTHRTESLGGLMALNELVKKADCKKDLTIARTSSGKPYFEKISSLPFGISHSKGIVAAALGESECVNIGLDIEIIDPNIRVKDIAERFFSKEEFDTLEKTQYSPECFYSLWTAKEALSKLDGDGLASIISGQLLASKKDAFLSRRHVDIGGRRAVISIYCYASEQPIQIFFDC